MDVNKCSEPSNIQPSQIITFIVVSVGITITVIILVNAIKEFPRQNKLQTIFKCLFYSSLTTSTLTQLIVVTATITCLYTYQQITMILLPIYTAMYLICLLLILTTLLLRLHYTFKDSSYKISNKTRNILIILYIFTILSCTACITIYMLNKMSPRSKVEDPTVWTTTKSYLMPIVIYLGISGGILYVITAVWANVIFTRNLIQLTHSRADSLFKFNIKSASTADFTHRYQRVKSRKELQEEVSSMELNDDQMRLINSISRYVSLFTIAILTSVINVLLVMSGEYGGINWYNGHLQILAMFSCLDCTVNICCLYLQYQFNIRYYEKWCKCIERCWRKYFIQKAKKNMHIVYRQSIDEERQRRSSISSMQLTQPSTPRPNQNGTIKMKHKVPSMSSVLTDINPHGSTKLESRPSRDVYISDHISPSIDEEDESDDRENVTLILKDKDRGSQGSQDEECRENSYLTINTTATTVTSVPHCGTFDVATSL